MSGRLEERVEAPHARRLVPVASRVLPTIISEVLKIAFWLLVFCLLFR